MTSLEKEPVFEPPFDFMRCYECRRILTLPMRDKYMANGRYCPCGAMKATPSWPVGLEWIKPSVIWFAILRTLGKI